MSASTTTSFAIRYCVSNRVEVVYPKTHLTHEQTQVELGKLLYNIHCRHLKFDYIRIVPCVKRPGTKPVAELSRNTMTEEQLRHACKYYHRAAVAAGR